MVNSSLVPTDRPFNPWERVVALIEEAGHLLNLDDGMVRRIVAPERSLEVAVPVRLDSGEVQVFTGWRIQHDYFGPIHRGW